MGAVGWGKDLGPWGWFGFVLLLLVGWLVGGGLGDWGIRIRGIVAGDWRFMLGGGRLGLACGGRWFCSVAERPEGFTYLQLAVQRVLEDGSVRDVMGEGEDESEALYPLCCRLVLTDSTARY